MKKARVPLPIVPLFRIIFCNGNDSYNIVPLEPNLLTGRKAFRLRKQTNGEKTYVVQDTDQGPYCDCPGFKYRSKCKHITMLQNARMLDEPRTGKS